MKIKHVSRAIGLAVTTTFLAVACASPGGHKNAADFPTGRYHSGDTVAVFNADGTFVGTTTEGEDWVKGTYSHTGGELKLVDTWESDSMHEGNPQNCVGIVGHYRWTLTGDVFTANVIDDACAGRKKGTDGVPWTRML